MSRYTTIPKTSTPTGKQIYKTVKYPEVPRDPSDIYVYTSIGDRLDTLALEYYGDSSLWWIISISNDNLLQNSLTPPVGTQLRIPLNSAPIIASYEILNE
tara:strand:- start:298 stop:597 length:300 start_codon:yes stop_codon:yes gene_type:complete